MTRTNHEYNGVTIKPLVRSEDFRSWSAGHRWTFAINGKSQGSPTLQGAKWLIDRQKETKDV